jgi:hypothetical protein
MKKLSIFVLFFAALFFSSCGDDAAPTGGDPFGGGGGGGGTGNVTFTVSVVQDQQSQDYYFEFKPSANITFTGGTASCPAANVNNQQITGDGTSIFSSTSPLYVGPVTNVIQSGQQWSFNLKGKIGSTTGEAYDKNVNHTIP